jgi:hypothetical protein
MSPINTASSVKRMKFREQNKRNAMKVTRIMKQVARLSRDKRRRKQVREEDETFLKVEEEVREEDETFLKVEEDETLAPPFLKVEEDETLVPKRAVKRRRTPLVRIKRKPGHRTLSSEKFEIFEGENEYDPVIVRPTLEEPIVLIEPKTFKIETCCRQLGSKQDYVASVTLDEDCHIIAAFDGHGQDYAIESIRTLDLAHHFSQENPSLSIQKEINAQTILPYARLRSGSTMTYSKVSRNRDTNEVTIGVHWVGDSPAWVFVNDQLVWDNTDRLHATFLSLPKTYPTLWICGVHHDCMVVYDVTNSSDTQRNIHLAEHHSLTVKTRHDHNDFHDRTGGRCTGTGHCRTPPIPRSNPVSQLLGSQKPRSNPVSQLIGRDLCCLL